MAEHISCDFKYKFNSKICFQIKNGTIKHVNGNVKIFVSAKMIIVGILAYIFVRIVSI